MMKFRTEVETPDFPFKQNYQTKTMFIGSCFTTNIGAYMQRYKFNVEVNPFGVLYNPASVTGSLHLLLDNKVFDESELLNQNGLWFSYSHHSSFSSVNKQACLDGINTRMAHASGFLRQTDFLFVTLGTAYTFQLKQSGRVVANCHKTQAKEFDRILLSSAEIVALFTKLIDRLLSVNPHLKIIFSVSPVRHLKDGAHGNQLSKANLLLAIDELQRSYTNSCFYFPAYELLLDDLRDYRFYADDMCHPSAIAVEYIWQKFSKAFIDKGCDDTMKQVEAIAAAAAHRPFNANTAQHKAFQQKTIEKIHLLQKQYPFMDFANELEKLK